MAVSLDATNMDPNFLVSLHEHIIISDKLLYYLKAFVSFKHFQGCMDTVIKKFLANIDQPKL